MTLVSGSATSSLDSALSVGTHTITAVFTDSDGDFSGSTSSNFTQTVNTAGSSTAVSSSLTPSVYGQGVTFTATVSAVSPGAGTPAGTVQFKVNGNNYGSAVTLVSGSANSSLDSALSVGTHTITAVFTDSDGDFSGSTSSNFTQTVNAATLTVTPDNKAMLAGTTVPALTYQVSGFVNGQNSSVLTGAPNVTTTATNTSVVGDYPITATQGTLAAANYTFSFVTGWMTVADIRVMFGSQSYSIANVASLGRDLPWKISGIELVFGTQISGSASVTVTETGTNTGVATGGTSFVPYGVGGTAVQWQINSPITNGHYKVAFSGMALTNAAHATDAAINALFGNLTENFSDLYGNVNGDGVVNASDYTLAYNAMLAYNQNSANYNSFADVLGDGKNDQTDVNTVRSLIGSRLQN